MKTLLSDQSRASDAGLTEIEASVLEVAHKFAAQVMRPAGVALDRLTPEEVVAEESQLWDVFKQYRELGLNLSEISEELDPVEIARLTCLVNEELGWGDCGLGWSLYASGLAQAMIKSFGRDDLAEICTAESISMWSITEPNHGSDMLDFTHSQSPAEQGGLKSDCVAIKQGDRIVIRGQKSAWGSNGSIADVSALFCRFDDGSGEPKRAAFIVPLNLPGISRGKPLDKLGVRTLTDAELYFDNVEIPASYMLCPPEAYEELVAGIIMGANPGMAIFSVGLSRAAFEFALSYSKERIQGGRPIFEYQAIQLKLFDMYRKIQAARALIRNTMIEHAQFPPRFENAVSCKVAGTELAVEVSNQAFEIVGGNAISREYPLEKLLRDARLGTIADGSNDLLALMAVSSAF
jgi:alkylation response protein AidB-like acyl-CoA dehydrogenase